MSIFVASNNSGEQAGAALGAVAIKAVPVIGQIPVLSGFLGSTIGKVIGGIFGGNPSDNATGVAVPFGDETAYRYEGDKSNGDTRAVAQSGANYASTLISEYKALGANFKEGSGLKVVAGSRDGLRVNGAGLPEANYGQNHKAFFGGIKKVVEHGILNQDEVLQVGIDYNAQLETGYDTYNYDFTGNGENNSPYITTQYNDDPYGRIVNTNSSNSSTILLIGSIITAIIAMRG